MIPLHKLLAKAEGSELIHKCWGHIPSFDGPGSIIHLRQDDSKVEGCGIRLTGVFLTNEADDGNKCKPSRIVVRFSGVTHWESDRDLAEANGIQLAEVLNVAPEGFVSVDVHRSFFVVCRKLTVLSCEPQPFRDLEDETFIT